MKEYCLLYDNLLSLKYMLFLVLIYSQACAEVEGIDSRLVREFQIQENDTLSYTLKLALDEKGIPQYFFRNIFTPVCYTNECKPVHVNFYWDLLGNFQRYDMPKGKILTKVDHDEFLEKDYQKLQEILSRENSIFRDLEMQDLITEGTDDLSDSVDTKSGATLKTIKNEVIEGAVYTCFTLWKIAYGPVTKEIKTIISEYENKALYRTFLSSNNHHYQYYAVDKVMEKKDLMPEDFIAEFMEVIAGQNIFTSQYAIKRVEAAIMEKPEMQLWLQNFYNKAPYSTQVLILNRLSELKLSQPSLLGWIEKLPKANVAQRKILSAILRQQPLTSIAQFKLAEYLDQDDSNLAGHSYDLLIKNKEHHQVVRDKIRAYQVRHEN